MTNQQFAAESESALLERISSALETIRPALQSDGGDVELVDFSAADGVLSLRLTGACEACPISSMTVKHGIERRVKAAVPEVVAIRTV